MTRRSEAVARDADAPDEFLEELADVLVTANSGVEPRRVTRTGGGEPADVVAYLVNTTLDELDRLTRELEDERAELRRMRDRLALVESMAVIGEISATVAHELNQPITAVGLVADRLAAHGDDRVSVHARDVGRIADATRLMRRIVDGVRDYSRRGPTVFVTTPAAKPALDALTLLEPSLEARGIEVHADLPEGLPEISADPDRLEQVFVNLVSNAQHALESLPAGRARALRVGVEALEDRVVYRVEDDGPGIPEEHLPRLFEPFYTTKRLGVGTGLGLALARRIVGEHGGRLTYERGAIGARFVVELPLPRRP